VKKTVFRTQNTQWVNPTNKTVKLDMCLHAGAQPDGQDQRATVLIPPQGTAMSQLEAREGGHILDDAGNLLFTVLSSEFDSGIHQKDENGRIIGGLAPQLRVYREADANIDAALQPERHALEEARKVEKEKQLEAGEAERARLLAQSAAREAEDAKVKSDAIKAKEEAARAKAEADKANTELEVLKAELAKAKAEKNVALTAAADANKAKAETEALLASATAPAPSDAPADVTADKAAPKGKPGK
jgi:hypothetical protein